MPCHRSALLPTLVAAAVFASGCVRDDGERLKAVYDEKTGVLERLDHDSDGDGRVDTRTFMRANRPVRSEIDANGDEVIDRWEYYDAAGQVERVGTSSAGDGKEDTWTHREANGEVLIARSTRRTGAANRREYWVGGAIARADEDSNGDGRTDRWETYRNGVLATLAFDSTFSTGAPDRRLIYGRGGAIERIETNPGTPGEGQR
jgi:hypothetical protein